MIHDAQSAQTLPKEDGHNTHVIIKIWLCSNSWTWAHEPNTIRHTIYIFEITELMTPLV